jgi:hypothetical protein
MPTAERPQYAQKLLEILGSPSNIVIKMTTYRKKWIPTEVWDNPGSLKGKLAWVICVNAKKTNGRYKVQGFIPIRQVKILIAKKDGDNLILYLETQNYLSCDDYTKFYEELNEEITNKSKHLPPDEKSFIACDISIKSVNVVDSSEDDRVNEVWNRIVDSLSSIDVYSNTIFYRIIGISKDSSYLKAEDGVKQDEPQKFYRLRVNEIYKLQVHYLLPVRQFDYCPQYIKISANEWIKIYDECKVDNRVDNLSIRMKPLRTSDEYPYKNTISLNMSIESSQLSGPPLRLPVIFMKEKLHIFKQIKGVLVGIMLGITFFVGETLPHICEDICGFPTSIIGKVLSTLAITLMPPIIAKFLKESD